MENDFLDRYQRQLSLSEVGIHGQRALRAARVMVVGLGGLGCPAVQYLAAAGIGGLVLVDADQVSLSNLHRQTLYGPQLIGHSKAEAAAAWVKNYHPNTHVSVLQSMFTMDNAQSIFDNGLPIDHSTSGVGIAVEGSQTNLDLILDCTDNFAARYAINDACAKAAIPWVYASIAKFEGQVSVFNVPYNYREIQGSGETNIVSRSLNYRDVFPHPPAEGEVQNCAESGVLGALAGIVGSLQAMEALKFILKTEGLLIDQLLTYDALTHRLVKFDLPRNSEAKL